MQNKYIILTIEPHGNFVFGLDTLGKNINRNNIKALRVIINNEVFEITRALKTYINHGRITSSGINEWIQKNGLINNSIKLIFELSVKNNVHEYTYYPFQANHLSTETK